MGAQISPEFPNDYNLTTSSHHGPIAAPGHRARFAIHSNVPNVFSPDFDKATPPAPSGPSVDERRAYRGALPGYWRLGPLEFMLER